MPLVNFTCGDCNHTQEHFYYSKYSNELNCPDCGSASYKRGVSRFKMNVEYSDNEEFMQNKVQPHIDEAYSKMGKEALNEDTKTAEDLFGKDKVEKTLNKYDEA